MAAVEDDVFVGDDFRTVDFVTLALSKVEVDVFGLVNVFERTVDGTGADLTREAVGFDAVLVLIVGLETVLK